MKNLKRITALCFAMISVITVFCFPANAAGNIGDTIISIEAKSNNGGTPWMSYWRKKEDYTSVWCENKSTSGGSLSAWVHRSNSDSAGYVNTVDRYYGNWSYNGATKNMKTLPKGTYYYLPNYVKEDGYTYATLGYIMNKEAVAYSIAWSPDSI